MGFYLLANHACTCIVYCILFIQANYFSRADVALPGFAKYFKRASEREMDNANDLMDYVNKRGGYLDYKDIPVIHFWLLIL